MRQTRTFHCASVSAISLLAGALALAALPVAAADEAFATPTRVAPGAEMSLVYVAQGQGTVEASVAEEIRCTLVAPGGEASDCSSATTLLEARVQGADRSYVFSLAAPDAPGDYVARFERVAAVFVALPLGTAVAGAEAAFTVAEDAVTPGGTTLTPTDDTPPAGGDGEGDGAEPGAGIPGASPAGKDAPRWLASVFLGSGALAASLFAAGRRGGL